MANFANRPEENLSSPFFLHPNENPSLILVSNVLNEGNYHSWYRSMKMTLISKKKYKFVDGSIITPAVTEQIYPAWERCNTMVMSWLYRSVSPTISQSISCMNTVMDIWNDHKERFSQGDAFRIGHIQEEIYAFHQNSLSVTEYFTHLKTLWDELMSLNPLPVCMCIPKCGCNAFDLIRKRQSNDQVIKFSKGLNEQFGNVRHQILMTEPLPAMNKVFSMVMQSERQNIIFSNMKNGIDLNIMMTRSSGPAQFATENYESNICYARGRGTNNYSRGSYNRFSGYNSQVNKSKTCSHCGYFGHTVDICYKKHGYPPGYQPKYRAESSFANQVEYAGNPFENDGNVDYNGYKEELNQNYKTGNTESIPPPGAPFPFSQEQCQRLMALLQADENKVASTSSGSISNVNSLSANFHAIAEDQGTLPKCLFNAISFKNTWILDTGATYHIVCNSSFLHSSTAVDNVHVKLPNGHLVPVSHIGTIQLTDRLILHNVLLVPDFTFNLISASKLTDDQNICLILYHDSCFIQEMHTWRMIGLAKKQEGLYILVQETASVLQCNKESQKTEKKQQQIFGTID
ncbi:uncharacterized protein LOC126668655 [Mercurialis annua]|uniref:uncharacterized protein LOC126668655 n=1 Tax=Mercurialis annua TaxID=3986 RepID=UPI0021601A2D|nr:uncharacterized protein LOC126668655 [Mercurialis annua]